jgi:hypothetical protein
MGRPGPASDRTRVLALPIFRVLVRVLVAILLAFVTTGCASFTPTVREPVRVGNTADLTPAQLGLRPQLTTVDDAREMMRARGLTGIAEDQFVSPTGPLLAVLAADYQSRVHVFRDGRYHESLALPTQGALPYGFVVRLGVDEASTMLLVLYRDPLGRREQPPELLAYRWRAPGATGAESDDPYGEDRAADRFRFELASRSSLAHIVNRHRGMTNPILVGTTFSEGALLFARDASGRIWDKGYLVRSTPDAVAFQAMPWATAMRCSCVQKYSLH